MKKFELFLVAVAAPLGILISVSNIVHAASGACYTISDADARTYCLARERREPAACYSIQRQDMRALCLAEVKK